MPDLIPQLVQPIKPAAKPGFQTSEFYTGGALMAACTPLAYDSSVPVCVRATALVVAGAVAVAYSFQRVRAKGA